MGKIKVLFSCGHQKSRKWEKEDITIRSESKCIRCITKELERGKEARDHLD